MQRFGKILNKKIKGIKLTRNKGHQAALLAGLMYAKEIVDITITIDADLQDDPKVIKKMIKFYMQGFDIVYGVRANRSSDSFNKRLFGLSKWNIDLPSKLKFIKRTVRFTFKLAK